MLLLRCVVRIVFLLAATGALATPLAAQTPGTKLKPDANVGDALVRLIPQLDYKGFTRHSIGMSREQTRIFGWTNASVKDLAGPRPHLVLVGGLDGSPRSVANVLTALDWFAHHDDAKAFRDKYLISAVACPLPEALRPRAGERMKATPVFPPQGRAYSLDENPEAHYLWRWLGLAGADLVIDVRAGSKIGWSLPTGDRVLDQLKAKLPEAAVLQGDAELVVALTKTGAAETGPVPAIMVREPSELNDNVLKRLLPVLGELSPWTPSPARKELQARAGRQPLEVARQLLNHYGRDLPQVQYIPAMALVARIRYGDLTKDDTHRAAVAAIVEKAFQQPPKIGSGSDLAGHLVLSELARGASDEQSAKLIADLRRAANLAFDPAGRPLPVMPFHSEMSDAIFMSGPLLAATGKLTGDAKYHDACVRHIEFMHKLCLRPDGIYRHSPLDDAAWGRGNGFGTLGLALLLADLPEKHPARPALLKTFQQLAARLKEFQDPSGMWREVIDQPGSYRELTATSMIAVAFLRGVRQGWLDRAEYLPAAERAWEGVLLRVPENGRLLDVCASTGKQKTLKDYLNRPAIHDRDGRGGAMALLFAVEMAVPVQP